MDDDGRVMIGTHDPAMTVRNLRRDPRVALAVFTDAFAIERAGRTVSG